MCVLPRVRQATERFFVRRHDASEVHAVSEDDQAVPADKTQLLGSLGFFKDWSNYLLVTTVAALGWVAKGDSLIQGVELQWTIGLLCASVVFAIFTLALIPIVGENLVDRASIYSVEAPFKLLWVLGPTLRFRLKYVCWFQHVLFLAAVVVYSVGSIAALC
jgi:hypothetical protein